MAVLFDNLPYKACRALPVLMIAACVVLVNPSLEISVPVVLIACVICTLLNVELAIENEAKYSKSFVVAEVGTMITGGCIFLRGFVLFIEHDPEGGKYGATMTYWVIVAVALLLGGVIAVCSGAGLTEDEALRREEGQNSSSSATQLVDQAGEHDPERALGSGLRGTVPASSSSGGPPAYGFETDSNSVTAPLLGGEDGSGWKPTGK